MFGVDEMCLELLSTWVGVSTWKVCVVGKMLRFQVWVIGSLREVGVTRFWRRLGLEGCVALRNASEFVSKASSTGTNYRP